jgi:hypothetical protein
VLGPHRLGAHASLAVVERTLERGQHGGLVREELHVRQRRAHGTQAAQRVLTPRCGGQLCSQRLELLQQAEREREKVE